ncbi:ras-related protein Rab-18-like [Oscarella lobularis]|uniref:ras-related protein Rab-18-like n=1 Tax=Oscarella lobularis TaxID=121494 RepID=UPI0033134644
MSFCDYGFKILLLGDLDVGKSSLVHRFHDGKFDDDRLSTIGVNFFIHELKIKEKIIKLHIWDTAGEERHRSIANIYYRDAVGIFLVFDLTSSKSFHNAKTYWIGEIEARCRNEEVAKILIGNKCDSERAISSKEIQDFANEHSMIYMETSAKEGTGVIEAFSALAEQILATQSRLPHPSYSIENESLQSIRLHSEVGTDQSSWWSTCCF